MPPELHEPVRSDIPTLLLSSERDPVTPPDFAERVAANLSHHRHVVFAQGGHGRDEACVAQMVTAFLDRGLEAVDPACAAHGAAPTFALPGPHPSPAGDGAKQ